MTREKVLLRHLSNQARALFWQYAAGGQQLASPTAVSAYRSSFLEFLEYAARHHHLGKLTQIRKRHIAAYIRLLKSRGRGDFLIAKRVYAICFWLELISQSEMRLPTFDSLCSDYPELAQARFQTRRKEGS